MWYLLEIQVTRLKNNVTESESQGAGVLHLCFCEAEVPQVRLVGVTGRYTVTQLSTSVTATPRQYKNILFQLTAVEILVCGQLVQAFCTCCHADYYEGEHVVETANNIMVGWKRRNWWCQGWWWYWFVCLSISFKDILLLNQTNYTQASALGFYHPPAVL